MTYVFRCKECDRQVETKVRTPVPICAHRVGGGPMRRDWRAESVQVDRFALRVGGTRWSRREPLGTEEAIKYNKERTER